MHHKKLCSVLMVCLLVAMSFGLVGCPNPGGNGTDEGLGEGAGEDILVAQFSATPTLGMAPQVVQFSGESNLGGISTATYSWNFGDGSQSTEQSPVHTYETAGQYTVSLTITTDAGSDTETKEAYVTILPAEKIELQDDVVVVEGEDALTLVDLNSEQLVFTYTGTGPVPVEVNSVLVGDEGEGYLRRVSGVEVAGETVTVSTEPAALTDLFEEVHIRSSSTFTQESFEKTGLPVCKGLFAKLSLDANLYSSDDLIVNLSGDIEFIPTVNFDLDINLSSVEYLKLVTTGTLVLDCDLDVVSSKGMSLSDTWSLFDDILHTPKPSSTVGSAWPPVWVTTELDFIIGFSLEAGAEASVNTGFDTSTAISIGAEYDDGTWTNLSNIDIGANYHGPTWDFDAGVEARIYIKPVISTRIYSMTGPRMAVTPYANFNATFIPPPMSAELGVGINGELGFDLIYLKIFSWDFNVGYEREWPGPYYSLWSYADESDAEGEGESDTWQRNLGGASSDSAFSVQQTTDGGYIVAGSTESFGAGVVDMYLVKTDANGTEIWTKTFGGTSRDGAFSVQQTTDGGYIVAGLTLSFGADEGDIYLVKTDANGTEIWSKTFGGTSLDGAMSVQQTADGGYILVGYTSSFGVDARDMYLVKTDSSGGEVWTKTFGGTSHDGAASVQQTADGGYIVAGTTESSDADARDMYLVKTDSSGSDIWTKTFGGSSHDEATSVQQTADGGYILVGYTSSFGAGYVDIYLVKTDSSGDALWTETFGGVSGEIAMSVQQTTDGGYIVAGFAESFGAGVTDMYLVKTDANGTEIWTKTFGGTSNDTAMSVQQTADGGYIVAGSTFSFGADEGDIYLVKTDSNGNSPNPPE